MFLLPLVKCIYFPYSPRVHPSFLPSFFLAILIAVELGVWQLAGQQNKTHYTKKTESSKSKQYI